MPAKSVASFYDSRIRRAEYLAGAHPFAQEVLLFYKRIAEFQKNFYTRLLGTHQQAIVTGSLVPQCRKELPIADSLPAFKEFLNVVVQYGPPVLAASAHQLSNASAESRLGLLREYWSASAPDDAINAFEQFLPRAFLQPYAELLALRSAKADLPFGSSRCPLCNSRPLLGILRQEGDGGKRSLLCSFCLHEWEFRRIICATCAEETETKLPVYVAEQFPYIRVEACDTCKYYLRTIDLTKDGNAVAFVDDLAAIPLSLWAEEHGYSRPQPNLLGT